ncbi:MAG: aerotolerance regulator BatA [Bacteroidetes bacterium]|nr:MAG: aerotolerance regulator BatA [Bacteroidota bacterium]
MIEGYTFLHPYWLGLLLLLPALAYWKHRIGRRMTVRIALPTLAPFATHRGLRTRIYPVLNVMRYLGLGLLIVAMARPQLTLKEEIVKAEGIDIFLVMDLSSSMLARDFDPDRLQVSKRVAVEFVDKRPHDRIGLAVFAGESFTQCPLTSDHRVIKDFLTTLECGILEDGTAIGMGLAAAVNRLTHSKAESKVIILLTDGVNNAGYINPMTAAEIAKEYAVKVYTVGVGTRGDALAPMRRRDDGRYIFGMATVEIDENLLRQIASSTGGQYFRATSAESLEKIYAEIDLLEKTEMDVTAFKRYSEEYIPWLLWGFGLLGAVVLMDWTVFRKLP